MYEGKITNLPLLTVHGIPACRFDRKHSYWHLLCHFDSQDLHLPCSSLKLKISPLSQKGQQSYSPSLSSSCIMSIRSCFLSRTAWRPKTINKSDPQRAQEPLLFSSSSPIIEQCGQVYFLSRPCCSCPGKELHSVQPPPARPLIGEPQKSQTYPQS